jgi:hypothetical protein
MQVKVQRKPALEKRQRQLEARVARAVSAAPGAAHPVPQARDEARDEAPVTFTPLEVVAAPVPIPAEAPSSGPRVDSSTAPPSKTPKKKSPEAQVPADPWRGSVWAATALEGHADRVLAVCFFGDHGLATGGADTTVRLWDLRGMRETHSLGGHTGAVTAIVQVGAGVIASASLDCCIKFWAVPGGVEKESMYVYAPVTCLAGLGGLLVAGTAAGKIQVWRGMRGLASALAHEDAVGAVAVAADQIVSASVTGELKVCLASLHSFDLPSLVWALAGNKLTVTANFELPSGCAVGALQIAGRRAFLGGEGANIRCLGLDSNQV